MSVALIALALSGAADLSEWHLKCVLRSDSIGAPSDPRPIDIILSGQSAAKARTVRFENSADLFDDDYRTTPGVNRRWKVKLSAFDGEDGFIDLTSYSDRPGHSARIWLSGEGAGLFKGRYSINSGMLSESFAMGDSGEATCRIAPDGAGQGTTQ